MEKKRKPEAANRKIILKANEPTELLKFLLAELKGKSRTTVKSYLSNRQVSINQQAITQFDYPIAAGQTVVVSLDKIVQVVRYKGVKILFEDDSVVVIEKEAGLLSIATNKERNLTAYNILSRHVKLEDRSNKIFVIHRLDRETSGVMMFAKNEQVQSVLQRAWQEAVIDRVYVAVVEGVIPNDEGTIRSFLKENKALIMYSTKVPGEGDESITHYKVIKRTDRNTLVEVRLDTGRKNQIRVHMKELGHPIVGDEKYGARTNPIRRVALHAQTLSFIHPVSGETVTFESPLPSRFLMLMKPREMDDED